MGQLVSGRQPTAASNCKQTDTRWAKWCPGGNQQPLQTENRQTPDGPSGVREATNSRFKLKTDKHQMGQVVSGRQPTAASNCKQTDTRWAKWCPGGNQQPLQTANRQTPDGPSGVREAANSRFKLKTDKHQMGQVVSRRQPTAASN